VLIGLQAAEIPVIVANRENDVKDASALKRHCTYCTYTHEDMSYILHNDSVYKLYRSFGGIRNEDAAKSVSRLSWH